MGLGDCGAGAGKERIPDPGGFWRPKREGRREKPDERLVVLNDVAKSVIDRKRSMNPTFKAAA